MTSPDDILESLSSLSIKENDIEPTAIETSGDKPNVIEPSGDKPTEVETSSVEPTDDKPTKVEPSCDKPNVIEPTEVEPPSVEPTVIEPTKVFDLEIELIDIIEKQHKKRMLRDIWKDSKWFHIAQLENDDVGKIGENFIQRICDLANISAKINGLDTKKIGGGNGDGTIYDKTVEIKTARQGINGSFQHELGEKPWLANYMIFVDIAVDKFYITIMKNFTEQQYKTKCKCQPYFPTKSFTWRKNAGAFKFDTSLNLNDKQSKVDNPYTFIWKDKTSIEEIHNFFNRIII